MKLHELFQFGSPEHVLLHAAWRESRRKQPSLSFGRINNPRLAYNEAVKIVGRTPWYKISLGGSKHTIVVAVIETLALQLKEYDIIRLDVEANPEEILTLVDLGGPSTEWSNPSFGTKNGSQIVEADYKSTGLGRWVARLSGTKK